MKNHYDVLELDKTCTSKEVKESFIKLSKKYHPDKNKSEEARRKIIEINEAYAVLKNASTRYQYDERLEKKTQKHERTFHQNREPYYYNKPKSYEEYVHYYQKMNRNSAAAPMHTGKFTLVLCCCMLMVVGAGLRVMYAWSEAYRRKTLNDKAVRDFAEAFECSENPNTERFRLLFDKKHKRQAQKKNSDS